MVLQLKETPRPENGAVQGIVAVLLCGPRLPFAPVCWSAPANVTADLYRQQNDSAVPHIKGQLVRESSQIGRGSADVLHYKLCQAASLEAASRFEDRKSHSQLSSKLALALAVQGTSAERSPNGAPWLGPMRN